MTQEKSTRNKSLTIDRAYCFHNLLVRKNWTKNHRFYNFCNSQSLNVIILSLKHTYINHKLHLSPTQLRNSRYYTSYSFFSIAARPVKETYVELLTISKKLTVLRVKNNLNKITFIRRFKPRCLFKLTANKRGRF